MENRIKNPAVTNEELKQIINLLVLQSWLSCSAPVLGVIRFSHSLRCWYDAASQPQIWARTLRSVVQLRWIGLFDDRGYSKQPPRLCSVCWLSQRWSRVRNKVDRMKNLNLGWCRRNLTGGETKQTYGQVDSESCNDTQAELCKAKTYR